jgi:hypothetical protein
MRLAMAASPSPINCWLAAPSRKYIGGLNVAAAMPITFAENWAANCPVTSSSASFGWSTAKLAITVAYVIGSSRIVSLYVLKRENGVA